ncbi:hypothetical protein [Haloarcula sp. JP-Z28]|uniref:hypothetical protein n=1 Tax=Haloarcula sp. JP-Z28 TaxID=2716715 RepID=UPI001F0348CF|nr:hypothetical protein [Haloarcula sp. JP-Z28]
MDRTDWPTPGPNEPVPAWDEYRQLREAVHDFLDNEPEDPTWADIWKALGAIMGEYQRDAFAQAFDLDAPAETACIRRLITGDASAPTRRLTPTATQRGRLTARQQTTTRHSGLTMASRRCTRCTSIREISSDWIPQSRPTISGSTSSSSLRSGD